MSVKQQYLPEYIAAIEVVSHSNNFQVRKTLLLFVQIMVRACGNECASLTALDVQSRL
jgi:hypothetical protein